MNIFNIILKLKGFDISRTRRELQRIQSLSLHDFKKYQLEKRDEIYKYHLKHSKSYREFLESKVGSIPEVWEDIPVMKKTDVQIPIENRLSDEFTTKTVKIHNTSGSTGQPFYFAKDKFCHAMTWANILDRYSMHDITYGKSKQARFYGISLSFPGYQKERFKDFLSSRYRFTVFDLSDDVLEGFLKKFEKTKFEYINGYTSSIVLFSEYLIKKNILLKDVCPTLKVVFPTSEMCSSSDREIIERATGVKVANEYGAAELDVIAFEDKDYDWIINEENLFIEILNENGKQVEAGESGKVVITSLYNIANAFIRYEVGDIGVLDSRTKGKYRILKELVGRTNDFILLPSGRKSPGLTFYYISKSLFETGGFMKEFIIIQKNIKHFNFEYVAQRDINEDEQKMVAKALDEYLEKDLEVSFTRKEVIERTKAGKIKHFYREF